MDHTQKNIVVIGGGLAGIIAAATAVKYGAKVTLLSSGAGTLGMSGGSVNIQGLDLKQPYFEEAMDFFTDMMVVAGCEYKGNFREIQLIPNAMGNFQEMSMAPTFIAAGSPVNGSKVMVVGIRGLSGFNANLTAELLTRAANRRDLQVEYTASVIEVPWFKERSFNTLDMANHLEEHHYRDKLAEIIKPLVKDYGLLLLPAILGQQTGNAEFARFEEKVGCSVAELNTVPPSVVGLRIIQCLQNYLQKAGVDINTGYPVQSLQLQAGHCTAVTLDTPGRKRVIKADGFIVATGRINIFNLAINNEGNDAKVYLTEDITVNEHMQLLNGDQIPIAANVYGAGSLLKGYDCRNGNSLAILTGYQAGIMATGVKS